MINFLTAFLSHKRFQDIQRFFIRVTIKNIPYLKKCKEMGRYRTHFTSIKHNEFKKITQYKHVTLKVTHTEH